MEFKPTDLLRKEQACIYFLSVGNWAVNRGLNMSPGRQQDFFLHDWLSDFFYYLFWVVFWQIAIQSLYFVKVKKKFLISILLFCICWNKHFWKSTHCDVIKGTKTSQPAVGSTLWHHLGFFFKHRFHRFFFLRTFLQNSLSIMVSNEDEYRAYTKCTQYSIQYANRFPFKWAKLLFWRLKSVLFNVVVWGKMHLKAMDDL